MSAHTPCMLMVGETPFDNDGAPETVIGGTGQFENHAIAVAIDFKNAPGMREANARRMVACWNALDGLHDDALGGGWTAAGMNAYAKGLEEKLRVMHDLLLAIKKLDDRNDIADHDEGVPCTSAEFDEVMASVCEVLKGGAT
ncbi:hypothetical protein [Janthinobacterium violaceinigrum]|uniref:Uncharacterized protein n=1 Tax=Janthinobacterium violaceinigrum TaxID=2654252 RepID=A0A6I1IFT8_9BURK|nr:hypothetical protein [Janthinobacterium violaceinigrum]KAB8066228.1 hypothetical protein GCN75_03235 [Janthinobacterium violaceinigrum]